MIRMRMHIHMHMHIWGDEFRLEQATHALVKSMISREGKWQPRYGVSPGYGSVVYHALV